MSLHMEDYLFLHLTDSINTKLLSLERTGKTFCTLHLPLSLATASSSLTHSKWPLWAARNKGVRLWSANTSISAPCCKIKTKKLINDIYFFVSKTESSWVQSHHINAVNSISVGFIRMNLIFKVSSTIYQLCHVAYISSLRQVLTSL